MSLTVNLFDFPFYTGTASVGADVPSLYPVALNGRGFLVDLKGPAYLSRFHHQSIPLLKPSQDTGDEPGERSLNTEGLWRRSQSSWHHGAGQDYLDLAESDRERFRSSKGIDVWTKHQLTLLPDTAIKRASASTSLQLMVVGTYLYAIDGSSLVYTSSLTGTPTWTTVTGGTGSPVSIASDGNNVYTAHSGNGIFKTTRGAATTASYVTGTATLVAYVRGRLMVAGGNSIYNVTTTAALGTAPNTALLTHANTDFAWVGFAEAGNFIFAAGYSGDKSLIYSTTIKSDGTALDVPHVAAELPDGEIVTAIQGYLSFIAVGTSKGVRFCSVDSNGNLLLGALIPTVSSVQCFEPQDRFMWFGWTNYDSVSTGLGRMDLSVFTSTLTPAYASDLMATAQGAVLSAATFGTLTVFAVSGSGIYAESTDLVATGTLDTGLITYDLGDDKIAMFLDVKHGAIPAGASHSAWLAGDNEAFTSVGSHTSTSTHEKFLLPQTRGFAFEVREQMNRGTTTTTGPTLYRHTLLSDVVAPSGGEILVPFIIAETLQLEGGSQETRDVVDDLAFIKDLREQRTIATYQEGITSYQVVVDDYDWLPHHLAEDGSGYNGTAVCKLKVVT